MFLGETFIEKPSFGEIFGIRQKMNGNSCIRDGILVPEVFMLINKLG